MPTKPTQPFPPIRVPRVDLSNDVVVVWVPGTNAHEIPAGLVSALPDFFTSGYTLVKSDYIATWDLVNSIPNGVSTLAAILDLIKKYKSRGTKVYLAGESQGALIISKVMSDPRYYDLITAVSLIGMPQIAENTFSIDPKFKTINHRFDPISIQWKSNNKDRLLEGVSRFMTGDVLKGVSLLIGVLPSNLLNILWLGLANLHKVPLPLFSSIPSFHSYGSKEYRQAVEHLWIHGLGQPNKKF